MDTRIVLVRQRYLFSICDLVNSIPIVLSEMERFLAAGTSFRIASSLAPAERLG
jgi:hypothetical protein